MVYVLLAEGFEEIEAIVTIDILRRAEIQVQTVSIQNIPTVMGAHGIGITADIMINDINSDKMEMVILPGGMPGTKNLKKSEKVCEILQIAAKNQRYIAAICAAPSVLGALGLLLGKTAVCFPGYENELAGANVTANPVEVDGKIITSRGAGTAHLFAFELVSLLQNQETASRLKQGMLYE